MQIIDVSNPSAPTPISLYSGDYQFIKGIQDYVYLTRNSTFSVLDVRDSSSVQYTSGFEFPGFIIDVAVSGNYLYTGSNGFRVIDISDSSHPVQVGYADVTGDLVEVVSDSLVIYCPNSMTANNTVHVMDVSDPENPSSLSSYTSPAMTNDLVIRDGLAYVACWWDGVRILDFKNPTNLHLISHTMGWTSSGSVPGVDYCFAQAVDVDGDYLYIVDYKPFSNQDTYGLYIIDISNPSAPNLVNRFQNITSSPKDVKVRDGIVYIADENGGVEVVDVTDPLEPSVLGYVDLIDVSTGIALEGDFAYVSEYILGGLQVVDISNPARPTLAGYYQPSGCFALGVESQNGYVYIADGVAGFQIYRNLLVTPVSVEPTQGFAVNNFILEQNYPNPFNPATTIRFQLPEGGNTILKIYDILGKEVATLVNEYKTAGTHQVTFNATQLSSGIYFYTLQSGGNYITKQMMLIK